MFNFRIINTPDGNQIIDKTLKTPYDSITPIEMMEYIEIDNLLYAFEQQKKMEQREEDRQKKIARNPFLRFACFCGII